MRRKKRSAEALRNQRRFNAVARRLGKLIGNLFAAVFVINDSERHDRKRSRVPRERHRDKPKGARKSKRFRTG